MEIERTGMVADRAWLNRLLERALSRRATLRGLFEALGRGPRRIIPGNLFREALTHFRLRAAFDELFQTPHIIELVDEIWAGRGGDGAIVEFHLAQSQVIGRDTPVGRINVELQRTIRFEVNDAGAVELRPGDIRLRWMLLTENLRLRLHEVETPEGEKEEVAHIAAGQVLSQRLPLKPLALPERPAIAAERDVEEALPDPAEILVVVHQLPGRIRYRVRGLKRNQSLGETLEAGLLAQAGIEHVSVSVRTGRLLIHYDGAVQQEQLETWINRLSHGRQLRTRGPGEEEHLPWHLLPAEEVAAYWGSAADTGLEAALAGARRREYGPNKLPDPPARSRWSIFFDQFRSLPIALLGASAIVSVLTGGLIDGVAILTVLGLNATIGFATENWAEKTIANLTRGIRPEAILIRNGREQVVSAEVLVPGDLIRLKRGMYIPADGRLVHVEGLAVDESTLTGESMPVPKIVGRMLEDDLPLAERANMVYRGTVVTGGSGLALVVATGPTTEVGLIQRLMSEARQPETPLQRQLDVLSGQLALLSLGVCGALFGVGLLRGYGFVPMMKIAVSLAVAAVPEGLPTVATTTLALGVRKLKEQDVFVRRLSAVETLGAIEYACLDKTGTITVNRMSLVAVNTGTGSFQLETGKLRLDGIAVSVGDQPDLVRLLELTLLCSEVEIDDDDSEMHPRAVGTPTESALVQAALDLGLPAGTIRAAHPLQRMRLRSEQRTFMDTLHRTADDGVLLAVKGHPVQVLDMCHYQLVGRRVQPLTTADRVRIATENERMAGRALRVLGVAYGEADVLPEEARDLIWVGLAGIADPPRREMAELISRLHRAGIHTTMITGDQSATASAIAREIGLIRDTRLQILDSSKLEELEPDVLRSLAEQTDVFSRVTPAHKLQIVQALQKSGHVVAMTGDGVNDGPALRAADIGIALGRDGSEVAQDVADMVIYDDDLATLVSAVEQGRTIYADIRKAVHFIVSSNISEILVTFTTTTAGLGEPMNPMQLLWINLVTDVFPELALGVEPPESDILNQPPRDPNAPMFDRQDRNRILSESLLLTAGTLSAYAWGLGRYGRGPYANTMAFTTLTVGQLFHAISCRSEPNSIFDGNPLPPNPYMPLAVGSGLALQLAATTVPGLRSVLGAARLGVADWLVAGATSIAPFIINELRKIARRAGEEATEPPEE